MSNEFETLDSGFPNQLTMETLENTYTAKSMNDISAKEVAKSFELGENIVSAEKSSVRRSFENFGLGVAEGFERMSDPQQFSDCWNLARGNLKVAFSSDDEGVEEGKLLMETAKQNIAKRNREIENKYFVEEKDKESFARSLGSGAADLSVQIATGLVFGAAPAIGMMAVQEYSGELQKRVEKVDIMKDYDPEKARTDLVGTGLYTGGSVLLEKRLGLEPMVNRIFKSQKPIKAALKGVLSEGGTEFLQANLSTMLRLGVGHTITWDDLPDELRNNVIEGVAGGILGGTASFGFSVYNRARCVDFVENNYGEALSDGGKKDAHEQATLVVDALLDSASTTFTKEIVGLSELGNKQGALYEKLQAEIGKAVTKNAMSFENEVDKQTYIDDVAWRVADWYTVEALKRNVPLDEVINANEIYFDGKGINLKQTNEYQRLKKKEYETKLANLEKKLVEKKMLSEKSAKEKAEARELAKKQIAEKKFEAAKDKDAERVEKLQGEAFDEGRETYLNLRKAFDNALTERSQQLLDDYKKQVEIAEKGSRAVLKKEVRVRDRVKAILKAHGNRGITDDSISGGRVKEEFNPYMQWGAKSGKPMHYDTLGQLLVEEGLLNEEYSLDDILRLLEHNNIIDGQTEVLTKSEMAADNAEYLEHLYNIDNTMSDREKLDYISDYIFNTEEGKEGLTNVIDEYVYENFNQDQTEAYDYYKQHSMDTIEAYQKLIDYVFPEYSMEGLYQIGGVKALNAPLEKLDIAEQMLAEGKSNQEIWEATGWEKAVDGKWRFEIPDGEVVKEKINFKDSNKLTDIYKNDKLYESYPFLQDLYVEFVDLGRQIGGDAVDFKYLEPREDGKQFGQLIRLNSNIFLKKESDVLYEEFEKLDEESLDHPDENDDWYKTERGKRFLELDEQTNKKAKKLSDLFLSDYGYIDEKAKKTLVHEIQHIIQKHEGFAAGGNLETRDVLLENLKNSVKTKSEYDQLKNQLDTYKDALKVKKYQNNKELVLKDKDVVKLSKNKENADEVLNEFENVTEMFSEAYLGENVLEKSEEEIEKAIENLSYSMELQFNKSEEEIKRDAEAYEELEYFRDKLDVYKSLYGEVESRNVENRLGLSAEEKAKTPISETQDIKNADAIVTFDGRSLPAKRENVLYQEGQFKLPEIVQMALDPKLKIAETKGKWTKNKILNYLKKTPSLSGVSLAAKAITQFDSFEDFKDHVFYHGAKVGTSGGLKPSITMTDKQVENLGGGGYGTKYWAISLSKSKKIASRFATAEGSGRIYPVLLLKNANVVEMTDLQDSADIDSIIEDLYNKGVDAVWIGDKESGEQELAVVNPRAIVNVGSPEFYKAFKLGSPENPINIKSDAELEKVYNYANEVIKNNPKLSDELLNEVRRNVLWQGETGGVKGSFNPSTYLIKLTQNADYSTLPHEFAHSFLQSMIDYMNSGNASEQYQKYYEDMMDEFRRYNKNINRERRDTQEYFARQYERYLRENKADSEAQKFIFDNFEKWLKKVYNDVNVPGSEELSQAQIDFFNSHISDRLPAPVNPVYTVEADREKEVEEEIPSKSEKITEKTAESEQIGVSEPLKAEKVETKPVETEKEYVYPSATEDPNGLSSRVYERMNEDGYDLKYGRLSNEEQSEKATKIVNDDIETARKMIDREIPMEDNDLLRTALFIAYENKMMEIGNYEEFNRVRRKHSLEKTRVAQELQAEQIGKKDLSNPSYWLDAAEDERAVVVANKLHLSMKDAYGNKISATDAVRDWLKDRTKRAVEKFNKGASMEDIANDIKKETGYDGELFQMGEVYNNVYDKIAEMYDKAMNLKIDDKQAREIIKLTEKLQSKLRNVNMSKQLPLETFDTLNELMKKYQELNPSSNLAIITSTVSRGMMLSAPATHILNIVSNAENGLLDMAVRRFKYKATNNYVDQKAKEDYNKYAKQVFQKSGLSISTMTPDEIRTPVYRGETTVSSQGEGKVRSLGRFLEKWIFKDALGYPDMISKNFAFVDTASLLCSKYVDTKFAEKSLEEKQQLATELFNKVICLEPRDATAIEIRGKAIADAQEATFTDKGTISKFVTEIRESLNKVTGDLRFGDYIAPFVATPANVVGLGLEYSAGVTYGLYHALDIAQDIRKGTMSDISKNAITYAFRNGMGMILAGVLASLFDEDDYIPAYELSTLKDRDLARLKNAPYNSIKFGNSYISLDYFGPLTAPLVGFLQAKRDQNLVSYIKGVGMQFAQIPVLGSVAEIVQTIQNMSADPERAVADLVEKGKESILAMVIPNMYQVLEKMVQTTEKETREHKLQAKLALSTLPSAQSLSTGGEIKRGFLASVESLLAGGRARVAIDNDLVREFDRLNKAKQAPNMTDMIRASQFKDLSIEERQELNERFAPEFNKKVNQLIKSSSYKRMDDESKKKEINKIRKQIIDRLKKTKK